MALQATRRAAGTLRVDSRDASSVTLLKHRETWARPDVWPFLALYACVVAIAISFAVAFQWFKFTICCYVLGLCALLHALALLASHWSVKFKAAASARVVDDIQEADAVFVEPVKHAGKPALAPLERRVLRQGIHETVEVSFDFRKQRFIVDVDKRTVSKLEYPVQETFGTYQKWSGHGSQQKELAAYDKYGVNRFEVPVPPFGDLLKEQLTAPFFCFQVFCVVLWMLDEYWYYSLFTLFMLVSFECTVVHQRLRNLKELRSMQTAKQQVQVYRCGQWRMLPGEALLVGDLISIGRATGGPAADEEVVPADLLLIAGSCIVEEAVLTGESTPQWKVSIADLDPNERLDMKNDKNHLLFSGTRVLQNTPSATARVRTPDGGCLAAVIRTGYETSQGQLMRTIMFSSETVTANSWEAGAFILFLLVFAVAAAWYVLKNGLQDPSRDRFKLVLNCIMIITSVIPPELPMELSMAVNASLLALSRKRVFCTEPFRIPYAGKVEVCCFDKTGTLTSDHLLLEEVVGPGKGKRSDLIMATCQSLVQIGGSELVGDPLEKASLEACGWRYAEEVATSPDGSVTAAILHRFHFNSNLKRMSVLVRCTDKGGATSVQAVTKGAPEVVKQFLVDVPVEYDKLYKSYAAQGARVIALATKTLGPDLASDPEALKALTRVEVEADMEWAGFAIFQCPLKPESEPALKALADSSHQLMMITGDAPLTACFAASKVHIVTRDVLVLGHREEEKGQVHGMDKGGPRVHGDGEYEWVSPDESVRLPFSRSLDDLLSVASQYDLAVSGEALGYVESIGLAPTLIPLCQVFARVSPEQKELVLVTLKAAGRITLMCGDGTNDVGGLKAAHVGVALLSASEAVQKMVKDKAEAAKADKAKGASSNGISKAGDGPAKGKGQKMLDEMTASGKAVTPSMQKMAKWLDDMEKSGGMPADMGDMPMVKPGDASMASPFTAKAMSVLPCTDIIKQGRCTLVTTVQMFKILGLLCLSTAYALSVMYLQGVKLSDAQATLNGVLTAGMFFFISQAKPLNKLSPTRPHPSIFNPYFFISLLGQFAVQMSVLIYMYNVALREMPPIERLSTESEFKPNLVNSVCYLVEAAVQLSTFGVNYVGHPFNSSIYENRGMYSCLFYMFVFLGVITFDLIPGLGELFGLVSIPNHIRWQLVVLCLGAFGINYFLEHTLRGLFPAKKPPPKGFMMHRTRLKQLRLPPALPADKAKTE